MEELKSRVAEMLYEFPVTLYPFTLPEETIIDRDFCALRAEVGD